MKESAGLSIVYNNKLLLLHPTGRKSDDGYSIPKGKIEEGEGKLEAAIRETKEETGILVPEYLIGNEGPVVEYRKKKKNGSPGGIYKKVYWFLVEINSLSELEIESEEIKEENLALDEVDWGGFLGGEELRKKVFWRFRDPICKYLNLI